MENELNQIFAHAQAIYLSALMAGALFFGMVGLRELRGERMEGFLYLVLASFFFVTHFFYLMNLPVNAQIGSSENLDLVWNWLARILAPAVIILFVGIGTFNLAILNVRQGAVKMFFGITLALFLYILGASWAVDIKAVLTVVWSMIWFDVELETASA